MDLIDAIIQGDIQTISTLLESEADPNHVDDNAHVTPLHYAVIYDLPAAIPLLLEAGAQPNIQNEGGKSPMDSAIELNRNECIKLLSKESKNKNPKGVILAWIDAFNQGDAQKIAELYTKDAINHQVVRDPVKGKSAIYEMFKQEFSEADMHCIVENIFEDGDWVILEWKDPLGLRGCGFFRIFDGKIAFQRGYWDRLSFLKLHDLPIPDREGW